jgi:hypothetical protein
MALLPSAASSGFTASANHPTFNGHSMLFRFNLAGTGGSGSTDKLWAMWNTDYSLYAQIQTDQSTFVRVQTSAGLSDISLTTSQGTWYDVGLRVDGTTIYLYCGPTGGAWSSTSRSCSTITAALMYWATENATNWAQAAIDDVRQWDAVLTADELERERWSRAPKRFANLHRWIPTLGLTNTDVAMDRSGNGYNLTVAGTTSIVDGAPVGWGAPIIVPQYTSSNAPVLSLPGVQSITATSAVPKVTLTR